MQQSIVGKWQQPAGQPYPGLWFNFTEEGLFTASYPDMGIESGGTYTLQDNLIELNQTKHTFGLTGRFEGRIEIDATVLKMAMGNEGEAAPSDLSQARQYNKILE